MSEDSAQTREKALEDELQRLRQAEASAEAQRAQAVAGAVERAARAETEATEAGLAVTALQQQVNLATHRADAAEAKAQQLSEQLCKLQEVEVKELREKAAEACANSESHRNLVRALQQRIAEQSQQAETEQAELRRQLAEASYAVQRALLAPNTSPSGSWDAIPSAIEDTEAATPQMIGRKSSKDSLVSDQKSDKAHDGTGSVGDMTFLLDEAEPETPPVAGGAPPEAAGQEEVAQLWDRINYLEKRCRTMQKKLDARPIIFQPASGHGPLNLETGESGHPRHWEPWLREALGPVVRRLQLSQANEAKLQGLAASLCEAIDQPLRSFTQGLLRRDAWLWVFYVHLLVLYAITASCIAKSSNPVSPAECVDARLKQLQAAKAASVPQG